ncbi:MAG: ecotin [Cyanobacteria bacterium K_Offshore_surface_m2_239]|nr:ecotin [Cyanobacteria bacterium K_Offshore_surface_m2_239]
MNASVVSLMALPIPVPHGCLPSLSRGLIGAVLVSGALSGALFASPAEAAPQPDLRPYPPAAPGERRWFIRVDSPPGAPAGPPMDQRVELVIGRSMRVDCNRHLLQGTLVEDTVPGWGYPLFRVKGGSQLISTRMACPGQAPRREFVALGGNPTLVPVNPKLPIVVVAPKELEVRWRLWRPEPGQQSATPF